MTHYLAQALGICILSCQYIQFSSCDLPSPSFMSASLYFLCVCVCVCVCVCECREAGPVSLGHVLAPAVTHRHSVLFFFLPPLPSPLTFCLLFRQWVQRTQCLSVPLNSPAHQPWTDMHATLCSAALATSLACQTCTPGFPYLHS